MFKVSPLPGLHPMPAMAAEHLRCGIMVIMLSDMPIPKVIKIDETVTIPYFGLASLSVDFFLLDGNSSRNNCESITAEDARTTEVTTACLNSTESST